MKKDYVLDYAGFILVKALSFFCNLIPTPVIFFLARRLGELAYVFDYRHKATAFANLKVAFPKKSNSQLHSIIRASYRNFLQNFIETLRIRRIDKDYVNTYIRINGSQYIQEGLQRGKGVILLGMHEGSWEVLNVVWPSLGYPFVVFVREQNFPRLNGLLNHYRSQKGCRIIQRGEGMRRLVEVLKNNMVVGMSADQGGKDGIQVKFFGRLASMPFGAVKLALKYDTMLLPGYYRRIKGPFAELHIGPPFQVKRTGDEGRDLHDNVQELMRYYEKHINASAQEYMWSYRIWKYSRGRHILVLSDGKAGHLRQAQAAAEITAGLLKDRGMEVNIQTEEVIFKNKLSRHSQVVSGIFAGGYACQGCAWCLNHFLKPDSCRALGELKPDIIISCGASLAPVNYILARQSLARSIVVMKPPFLDTGKFDLVIIPRHDYPPRRKNIVITDGALNLINERYLKEQSERMVRYAAGRLSFSGRYIGVLIGGDTRGFCLGKDTISELIAQLKQSAEKTDARLLVTTSRRTSSEIDQLIKNELKGYERCALLIIANEENIPEAVGGILGLSQIIVTSSDSISMICEAASSAKPVIVFNCGPTRRKLGRFVEYFAAKKYIQLVAAHSVKDAIGQALLGKTGTHALRDNLLVREAIDKIL